MIFFFGLATVLKTWITVVKFTYSEKATKFCEISTLLLTTVHTVKSKVEILQNFVAFSEYMNFKTYLVWFGFSLRNYQELEFWHPIIITFKIIALLFFSAKCNFNFSNIIFKFIHSQKKTWFSKNMPYLGSSNQIQLKSPNGIMGKNLHLIRSAPSNSTTVQHTIKMEQEKIRYLSNSQYVLTYTPSHSCPFFYFRMFVYHVV